MPLRVPNAQRPEPSFAGTRNTLEYVGFLPAQIKPGLFRFRFFFDSKRERGVLRLAVQPIDASGEGERIEDLDVLKDVEEVRFAYLQPRQPDEPPAWVEEWNEELLPAAVSIRVRIRGQEPWPAIVIAPRIEPIG